MISIEQDMIDTRDWLSCQARVLERTYLHMVKPESAIAAHNAMAKFSAGIVYDDAQWWSEWLSAIGANEGAHAALSAELSAVVKSATAAMRREIDSDSDRCYSLPEGERKRNEYYRIQGQCHLMDRLGDKAALLFWQRQTAKLPRAKKATP